MIILNHYSDPPKCKECSISDIRLLTIDGGGSKHRKIEESLIGWIKRNNFPDGF